MKFLPLMIAAVSLTGLTYAAGGCCPVSAAKSTEADIKTPETVLVAVKPKAPATSEVVTVASETVKVAVADTSAACSTEKKCDSEKTECSTEKKADCDTGKAACDASAAVESKASCETCSCSA